MAPALHSNHAHTNKNRLFLSPTSTKFRTNNYSMCVSRYKMILFFSLTFLARPSRVSVSTKSSLIYLTNTSVVGLVGNITRCLADVTNWTGCTAVTGSPPFISKWPRRICKKQGIFLGCWPLNICQTTPAISRSELFSTELFRLPGDSRILFYWLSAKLCLV